MANITSVQPKKTFIKPLLATAIMSACISVSAPVMATEVAVVNIQSIMRQSTAAKSVREQLEQRQKQYQTQVEQKERELNEEQQSLMKQQGVLSKEAYQEKVIALQKKVTTMQKEVAQKKSTLDRAFERALNDIQKSVTDIIKDLSASKGFDMAIPTSQILYAKPDMDISDDVLGKLNQKLPKLDVNFE